MQPALGAHPPTRSASSRPRRPRSEHRTRWRRRCGMGDALDQAGRHLAEFRDTLACFRRDRGRHPRDTRARRLRRVGHGFLHRGLLLRRFHFDLVHRFLDGLRDGLARFLRAGPRRAHALRRPLLRTFLESLL